MNTIDSSFRVAPVTNVVDDAVGVEESLWYVAIVKHNTEKSCGEKLNRMGIQNYIPIQTEYRIWGNGRKAKVDRVVIPSTVFIKCTEQERREIVKLPFINRFMTNKAGTSANNCNKPLAIIPDQQIDILKFMLHQSEIPVNFLGNTYKRGDKVRIVRGDLVGLEGIVMDLKNAKSEFLVSINIFGYARLLIDTINLIKI